MGASGESLNPTHNTKKMDDEAVMIFRDRFQLKDITDEQVGKLSFYRPAEDSPELKYMREKRAALGGSLPQRRMFLMLFWILARVSFKFATSLCIAAWCCSSVTFSSPRFWYSLLRRRFSNRRNAGKYFSAEPV